MKKQISFLFIFVLLIFFGCDFLSKPKVLVSYKEYSHIQSIMGEAERMTTIPFYSMKQLADIEGLDITLQSKFWMISPGDSVLDDGLSMKMYPWTVDDAAGGGFKYEVIIESHEYERMKYSFSSPTSFEIVEKWTISKVGSEGDSIQVHVEGIIELDDSKSEKAHRSNFERFRSLAIQNLKNFVEKHNRR